MSTKKITSESFSLFKREIFGLIFLGLGIFFFLSFLSYNPLDPSFLSLATQKPVHNLGGIFGAYLADGFLSLFGAGAYCLGFFFILRSLYFFAGWQDQLTLHEIPLYFAFAVLVGMLFQLTEGKLNYGSYSLDAGGLAGGLLAHAGVNYLGRLGSYLIVLVGLLLNFVWATRLSLRQILAFIFGLAAKSAQWAARQTLIYSARLHKNVVRWREARRAGRMEKERALLVKIDASVNPVLRKLAHEESPFPVARKLAPLSPSLGPKILERADKAGRPMPKAQPSSSQLELCHIRQGYELPPLSLLDSGNQEQVVVDEESLKMNARLLEKKLLDFGVEGFVAEIHPGPVITMYEFQPAAGVKLSRISNLADDLCLAMGGRSVRVVAPLPNKPAVGIEIPNNQRETVWLKDVIVDQKFQKSESKLVFALGKDIEGHPYVADLAKMPHLLVAGATGAGKSVSINAMILSFLYKATPEEVRLIMVDPKMLELSIYEGIPHLLLPVVTEPKKATLALRWAVREMERRYKLLSDVNARNIQNYNEKIAKGNVAGRQAQKIKEQGLEAIMGEEELKHDQKLSAIVIVIDELADLMMVAGRDVEEAITRLAQMARAAGIHLILATQRPSVDVITGIIKANFPARIAFKVSARHDSRTILDTIGAERLLGNGDMLVVPPGASKIIRAHGAFITEAEVGRVVEFLKQQAKPVYDESILEVPVAEAVDGDGDEDEAESDALYDQAVAIVAETKQASISMIQRKLRVGYNRAARMIEKMEIEGIVSPASGAGHRQVLVSSFEAGH